MRKLFFFLIIFFNFQLYSDVNFQTGIGISHDISVKKVRENNLVNKDNKLNLHSIKDVYGTEMSFDIKIPGSLFFHISSYFNGIDLEKKKILSINECFLKYFDDEFGFNFTIGKSMINNTIGNIFYPFNYFTNYFSIDSLERNNYDSSLSLLNCASSLFLIINDFNIEIVASWIPGFYSENIKEYYLSSIQNYCNNNIFQVNANLMFFNSFAVKILYAFIEKTPYVITDGVYNIFGISSFYAILDNLIIISEATLSNGHKNYALKYEDSGFPLYNYWLEDDLSIKENYFLECMTGIDLLLPLDFKLTIEYFYNQRGFDSIEANRFFQILIDNYNEEKELEYLLPLQRTYLLYHKTNKFRQHYVGGTISKLNIFDKFDFRTMLLYSPFAPAISSISTLGWLVSDEFNIDFNLILNVGNSDTEYGLELYDVLLFIKFNLNLKS